MIRSEQGHFRIRFAVVLIALALVGACLWAVLGRRQSTLDRWTAEMRAKGEKFTLAELGLDRPARTNAAMEVIEVAASRLQALDRANVSVDFQMAEDVGSARKRVAWAEANLQSVRACVLGWETLGKELRDLRPMLASIHEAMRDPPRDSGRDYTGRALLTVNLVAIRTVAQSLHDITMWDLHTGDLSFAHQNLLALVGMAHLHAESWTIVNQMIRSAIAGLAVDAVWNALQAPGWTDGQLAELQDKLASLSFFREMKQTIRAERAVGLYWYYDAKTNRNATAFGILNRRHSVTDLPEDAIGLVWESLWAETDLLFYCQHQQELIDSIHELVTTRSYRHAAIDFANAQTHVEKINSGVRRYRYLWSLWAIPNTRRALETLVKNETSRQLAIAAIGIERYKLRHGSLPSELTDLQPECLSDLPVDFYAGRPLHCRRDDNGGFTLYSAGKNFQDDGGGTNDMVWPKPVWPANFAK